jgi:hypothetical protein
MKCDNCESLATQIRETYSYCNRCHTREFSTIKIDGVERHFLVVLKEQLEKMGLQRKEGETIDQWGKRCREATSLNPKMLGGLA